MPDIIIAPFSNGDIRDWPPESFQQLIGCLLDAGSQEGLIRLIGAKSQAFRARDIVRPFNAALVRNDCGRPWSEVLDRLRQAKCVIGNNSGIAHLAARMGTPTVCIFGGAHQRTEWRPLGFNVVVLSRAIACAPCHLHRAADCLYGKACLEQISPEVVSQAALRLSDRAGLLSVSKSTPTIKVEALPSDLTQNTAIA